MKYLAMTAGLIGSLVLSSCAPAEPGTSMMRQGTNGMGNGGMMGNKTQGATDFLPGQGQDISSLPQAKTSEIIDVKDGETIQLNPTLVRTVIGGKEIAMYGYNGQIPGPRLQAAQGSTFTVNVTNNIDMPTAIHWHGIRVTNANDGAVGVTQEEIKTGQSFSYTVTAPDEGIYWYHSHLREDVQQPMGLYGPIVVTPASPDAYAAVDSEQVLMLNDLLVGHDGAPLPYGAGAPDHVLMGRFGNTFLVNGAEPQPIGLGLGTIARFMIINASNTRTYRVVPPPGGGLKIVGGDSGRVETEYMTDSYTLAPSERVIAEVYFWDDGVNAGNPGTRTVPLVISGPPEDPIPVQSVTIAGGVVGQDRSTAFSTLRTNADVAKSIDPFRSAFAKAPDHTLALSLGGGMGGHMMGGTVSADGIEWEDSPMNTMPMASMMKWMLTDDATGRSNEKLVYTAKVGDKLKIRIVNKQAGMHPMQHPIHVHGQRFLVLSENGVKNEHLVWKDTVLVPAGHTVDILLDVSNPGDWMFHCHIAEHLGNGMMGMLRVQ